MCAITILLALLVIYLLLRSNGYRIEDKSCEKSFTHVPIKANVLPRQRLKKFVDWFSWEFDRCAPNDPEDGPDRPNSNYASLFVPDHLEQTA